MTDPKPKIHVFISYSRQDYDFVIRLRKALDDAGIKHWIDQKDLRAGTTSWEQALRDAIESAYAVIYVGSEDARKSAYVKDEIALAASSKANIFPVWAKGSDWIQCVPLGFGGWQFVDLRKDDFDHNIGTLLTELTKETSSIVAPLATPVVLPIGKEPRNPYKGLNAFTEKDVADFFGREELVNQLLDDVKARMRDSTDRLLAVIGASGSGKSSVVMAGLLPRLREGALTGSAQWTYLKPMVPGNHPVEALVNLLLETPELNVSMDIIESDLRHPNGKGLHRLALKIPKHPVVLYIDQFEELFMTGVSEDERQQFISLLTYAVTQPDSPLLVILTLRADFYDRPLNDPELGRLMQSYNRSILPMTIADLIATVEKPASAAGLNFESGLVGDIIFDLREDKNAQAGALPLLQYTLAQLCERRNGNTLTSSAYTEIGGVKGAIGAHAEKIFLTLDLEAQEAFTRVFQALVHIDEKGTPTRKREAEAILINFPASARLVEALIKRARVLRVYTEKLGETPYIEVAHEALLISWERLSKWIKSADNDLRLIQEMKAAAARWANEGKPDHRLWSNELLQPIYQALARLPQDLTNDENDFIQPEAERLLEDFKTSPSHTQLTLVQRDFKRIGDAALPMLVYAYGYSNSDEVIDEIIGFLWNVPQLVKMHVEKAINFIDDSSRKGAAQLINRFEMPNFMPQLLEALKASELSVRQAAAAALGKVGDASVVPALLEALKDSDSDVRQAAAEALNTVAKVGDANVVPALLEALKDSDSDVRQAAAEALNTVAKVGDANVVPALLEALKDSDSTGYVRQAAAAALGKVGDASVVPALLEALKDSDPRGYVRQAAAAALGKVGDASVVPALLEALKASDPTGYVRQAAAEVLGKIKSADSISQLLELLNHPFGIVAKPARQALELMDIPESRAALAEYDAKHKR